MIALLQGCVFNSNSTQHKQLVCRHIPAIAIFQYYLCLIQCTPSIQSDGAAARSAPCALHRRRQRTNRSHKCNTCNFSVATCWCGHGWPMLLRVWPWNDIFYPLWNKTEIYRTVQDVKHWRNWPTKRITYQKHILGSYSASSARNACFMKEAARLAILGAHRTLKSWSKG